MAVHKTMSSVSASAIFASAKIFADAKDASDWALAIWLKQGNYVISDCTVVLFSWEKSL